ncbi:hypothetical protein ACIPSE_23310 [Streptomyces sp. NPDC090106]|uniref:hypothetical protein n=1 Tax=Streptomyces sp. NPDC090106 TaxID=3365946 RepID=UPI00382F4C7F
MSIDGNPMTEQPLHWEDVKELGLTLRVLEPLFTTENKEALSLVFAAAARNLCGERSVAGFDVSFIAGKEPEQGSQLFKISELFRGDPKAGPDGRDTYPRTSEPHEK